MEKYYKFSWKTKTDKYIEYYSVVNVKNCIKIMVLTIGETISSIEFIEMFYDEFKTHIINNPDTINITINEFKIQLELFQEWLEQNNYYHKYINNQY